jgi:LuxR family transcriptional regulator, maltose regulon positive regulatory protein
MGEPLYPGSVRGSSLAAREPAQPDEPETRFDLSSALLVRDRLTRSLQGSRKPLVLLAAPPGFGKTTLLRQWKSVETRPFALVSAGPEDNHPILFWTRILEAIRAAEPGFDSTAQIALHARYPDLPGVVLPLLAHDLRLVGRDLVLAIDDYQEIRDRACHESLEIFTRSMPANVTLVLSTRSDPPLHVGTLRARGDLFELRALDLCFTEREEATLLNEKLGLALDAETLRTLRGRTEGWPAGVYLASLSLQKSNDRAAFVAGFGGSNRLVVDYLTEVVLDSLDADRRRFLLDTSILDTVSAGLADAVTGRVGSAELIEELHHANLFLVPLDDERGWYRYHQLFADLLQDQLMRHRSDVVPTLHRRAAGWYAEYGEPDSAISHAVAAGDLRTAVELTAAGWTPALDSAGARRTLRRLETLGEDTIARDARLSLAKAWAAGMTDRREEAVRALETAESLGLEGTLPDGTSLMAAAAVVGACFPFGDVSAMLDAARRAHDLQDELEPAWRPLALVSLGWAEYLAGNRNEAEAWLQGATAAATEFQQWSHASIAHALLAHLALAKREHELAERRAREALAALTSHDLADALASGMAETALGAVRARSSGREGERTLNRGLVHLRAHGEPLLVAEALLLAAPVRRERHGTHSGRACIAEARELLESCADAGMLRERLEEVARSLTPGYRRAGAETELTERELEVLRYLAEGLPKRDIGSALFLSYNTIHSHTKSIYQKLRVSSREAAVEKARALGAL